MKHPCWYTVSVAALYISSDGPYPKLTPWCYDIQKDAREYKGPYKVVCHPPCGPWGRIKALSKESRASGYHALDMVHKYGGVIEQPVGSVMFDRQPGRIIKVKQCHWGHACEKQSLIYCYNVDYDRALSLLFNPPFPNARHTHRIFASSRPTDSTLKRASKSMAELTPIEFAKTLLTIAS